MAHFLECSGLEGVLRTGNLSEYPVICAEVTASFSVVSETINAVQKSLKKKHERTDLSAVISRLQAGEKEKLSLTAALHLEKIRAQAQACIDKETLASDTRISSLLSQGISSLQQKILATIDGINESLEELTMALDDESDE
jgi:cysteinyl-tRNA synthetase